MDAGTRSLADWSVTEWLNLGRDVDTPDLSGRVVVAAAFQMLCPGCVDQTVPQLRRAAARFPAGRVAVVGLHTVFEHHDVMTPAALRAFTHEYRITFPVGIDAPATDGGPVPVTMGRFGMQGTPTVMLYDRAGRLRRQTLGHVPDLELGFEVAGLLDEPVVGETTADPVVPPYDDPTGQGADGCDADGCRVPSAP